MLIHWIIFSGILKYAITNKISYFITFLKWHVLSELFKCFCLNYENCWQRGLSMHLHRTILKLRSLAEIINIDRDVYWRNNGSIVNVNIIECVSNKWILLKITCGGHAGAFPECPLLQVCVHLDGSNTENTLHLLVILCINVCDKLWRKKKILTTDIRLW